VGAAGVGVLGGASGMGGGGGLAGAAPDGAPPPTEPPPPEVPAPPPIPAPLAPPDPPAGACELAVDSVGMTGGVAGCRGLADGVTGCCATGTDLLVASMALAASGAAPPLAPRPGSAPASGRAPVLGPCWESLPPVGALVTWLVAALVDWALEEDEVPLPELPLLPGPAVGDEVDVGPPVGDGGVAPTAVDGELSIGPAPESGKCAVGGRVPL
jgi:hypothetical protein